MTTRKNRKILSVVLSFVFAVTMIFMPLTNPAWAEDGDDNSAPDKAKYLLKALSSDGDEEDSEGQGVHKNRETFEKNYDLSWEQKVYTIQEIERIADNVKDPNMSDLEKYYRLAILANQRVTYDWNFWGGGYDFDYYSHQWDSYGALTEKSVCVGIAIFYSHVCHAAGLPCKFVRLDPNYLDHTISYVPDINGKAYYADITENVFLMSEQSINSFEPNVDKNCDFATIPNPCTDASFDYYDDDGEELTSADLKGFYDLPYADWYNEYAVHDPTVTDKKFGADYKELGSGTDPNLYHASYQAYPSNFVEQPDVWFLDDFYKNPAEIKTKILDKEFDDNLVNVSGVKKNYDCDSQADLEAAVAGDIKVGYFPSSEGGEVVAKAANLVNGTDYDVTCTSFDKENNTAVFTVTGKGSYNGTKDFSVALNSAAVSEPPVPIKGLVYTGRAQELIEAGKAEEPGEMQYALGENNTDVPQTFTTDIPKATDAGQYYVWYRSVRDNNISSEPECMGMLLMDGFHSAKIAPVLVNIINDEDVINVQVGETARISPRVDKKVKAKFKFESSDENIATVDNNGVVTGESLGSAYITISADLSSANYKLIDSAGVTIAVGGGTDIEDTRVVLSQTAFTYNGKVQRPAIEKIKRLSLEEGTDYTATWSDESSKDAGTYTVTIKGKGDYYGTTDATYTINKAANPMTLKAKTVKVKRKSLKKKSKSLNRDSAFTVSNAQGSLSYKLVSAKKGKKSFKKKFKINKNTGNVTVKKRLKKGTYKVKVKVKANGDANYNASAWKTVTFKVRVK